MKTISFAVPCFNSAEYMEKCARSLLALGNDVEVILVNDGSTDDGATYSVAKKLEKSNPETVVVVDQENLGHGGAVNTGLAHAKGAYFKVVDSDDWLDTASMMPIMSYLRDQAPSQSPCDMVIANYVYEKVFEGKRQRVSYRNTLPEGREFSWEEVGRFRPDRNLLMHSLIFRTELLRECGITLPQHCFYVDNIFAYVPLPSVGTIRYFDLDAYRYFIGREGQSVNEEVMLSRIDMQLQITRHMIDAVDLNSLQAQPLSRYMYNYLAMMMCICSVFLRMEQTQDNEDKRAEIWRYLKNHRPGMYAKVRSKAINLAVNLPSPAGRALGLAGYRVAQKVFKFN